MRNLYILTHGCQMNEYDSKKISDLLAATHGLTLVHTPEEADVLVMNTCSIREKAQEKVFSELGRWRILKERKPDLLLAVGGCVASQEGEWLQKRAPYVDVVFGPQTLHRLPNLINMSRQSNSPMVDISFPEIEKFDHLPTPKAEGPSALVSIMEGCSKYCSYCVVPYTRGEEVSRPLDDVIIEVDKLLSQGVKEITLLGQNVNAYRGKMHDGTTCDLAGLIEYLAAFDDVLRIRFTTSHPVEFTDSLVDAYANIPKLVSHLHLPVQSGSDRILQLMKRGHTRKDYLAKIEKIKKARPGICISSDFIVAYPSETEADFMDTMNLIHDVGFDMSYSFIFSPRPGTPAANLPNTMAEEAKKERLSILQQRINLQARAISDAMVNTIQPVLITGRARKNPDELTGRTENNRVVNIKGPSEWIGKMIPAKIVAVLTNSLRAEAI